MKILLLMTVLLPFNALAASLEQGLQHKRAQQLPEAEAVFAQVAVQNPQDIEALVQLATVQGWQNRYREAESSWRRLLSLQPDHTTARIGLARILYWDGRRREALSELTSALLAKDRDAQLLQGDILLAEGDITGARRAYESARSLTVGDDDRDPEKLLQRTEAPLRWRLDAGHSLENFSRTRGEESASYLQLGHQLTKTLNLYLHWDRLEQFGALDQQMLAGAYWLASPQWLLMLEAGGTPDANFRPSRQMQLATEWLGSSSLQPLFGYRYFHYDNGDVHTLIPGLRINRIGPGAAELRYALSKNIDESTTGVISARYAWESGRFAPYIAVYQGNEALPPQAEASFVTGAAGCVFNLQRNWAVRVDYAYEDRDNFYQHSTIALGITSRF